MLLSLSIALSLSLSLISPLQCRQICCCICCAYRCCCCLLLLLLLLALNLSVCLCSLLSLARSLPAVIALCLCLWLCFWLCSSFGCLRWVSQLAQVKREGCRCRACRSLSLIRAVVLPVLGNICRWPKTKRKKKRLFWPLVRPGLSTSLS